MLFLARADVVHWEIVALRAENLLQARHCPLHSKKQGAGRRSTKITILLATVLSTSILVKIIKGPVLIGHLALPLVLGIA